MNGSHYLAIAIIGGLAAGFFISTLHQPTSTTPTGFSQWTANLYLSGANAAGATVTYY